MFHPKCIYQKSIFAKCARQYNTKISKISLKIFYSHLIMYQISNMKWELNGLFSDLPHYFPNMMHTSIETVPTCHNLCNGLLLLQSPQIAYMSVNNTTPLLLPLCLLIRYNCALCTCLTQPSDQVYTTTLQTGSTHPTFQQGWVSTYDVLLWNVDIS